MPKPKPLLFVMCYDSDLAHHVVAIRSTRGVAGMVGETAIINKPKRQTTIATSTYGAELNTRRVGSKNC